MQLTRESRRSLNGFIFTLPALAFIFSMLLFPLIYSLILSLTRYNVLYDPKPVFIGLANYIEAFKDPLFIGATVKTLILAAAAVPLGVLIPLGIALLLSSVRRFSNIYEIGLYIPIIIPVSLGCLIFLLILNPDMGYVNYFIHHVLYARGNFEWNGTGLSAFVTIMLVSQWQLGYQVVLLVAGLKSVDYELIEAAKIDGANEFQRTLYIKIPQIKGTLAVVTIFALIKGFKTFVQPMVMTLGGPNQATDTLYFLLYKTGFALHRMGYASTMAYILSILILLSSLLNLKAFKVD